MTSPVRIVKPWTVGGGGRLRELWEPGPVWIIAGRFTGWWLRHPPHTAVLAAGVAGAAHWRSWLAGVLSAVGVAVLIVAASIAWACKRGSARGIHAIVTGMIRSRKVRRRWPYAAYAAGVTAKGEAGAAPPLRDLRITQTGLTAIAMTGAVGRHSLEVAKAADSLAASMFCSRVIVRAVEPAVAVLRFDWGAHLAATYRLADLPVASAANRIVYGVRHNGAPAELVFNLSTLVVGVSGSGKSSTAWSIIAGYIKAGIPLRVRVLDPGQVEFDALRRALESGSSPIAHEYVQDFDQLPELWRHVDRALDARLAAVRDSGRREHVPTPDQPLDLLIIDELLPIAGELRRLGVQHTVGRIAYLGRKAGFVVVALSQASKVSAIGDVRDLFPQRLCLRTGNRHMTDAALGDGAHDQARCQDLDVDHDRGVGYSAADGMPGFDAFRAAWVPDSETAALAMGRLPAAPTVRGELEAAVTSLYRLYGDFRPAAGTMVTETDALLYVGISDDVDRRFSQHAKGKWWWPDVRRHVVETYPDRELAETAEALAIRRDRPRHNDLFNRSNPDRVRGRRWLRRPDGAVQHLELEVPEDEAAS